jgi:hypothetical protein
MRRQKQVFYLSLDEDKAGQKFIFAPQYSDTFVVAKLRPCFCLLLRTLLMSKVNNA